jgi:hypothetical protein
VTARPVRLAPIDDHRVPAVVDLANMTADGRLAG